MKLQTICAALALGALAVAANGAAAADNAKAEAAYKATCMACHGSGVMNAPKVGDKPAWKPRVAKGKPAVYANAIKGFNMMPARGGNPALKDDEVKAVVDYMIGKSS
ncbi:cytochrome c5 [Pseudoduganella flava]|uniref:C-type cytochrome n=1 Tax=Pseudoduganella flava TaxID=871742 RepID=A0A562PHD7_9BURK|nr:c-type cytochrome [Pseudoduganella flava]QGZ42673.1 c-type cytochrome [Pseudoduganella flava]TWI43839.1 cytochrome c5 [Pseudoduganella flava]